MWWLYLCLSAGCNPNGLQQSSRKPSTMQQLLDLRENMPNWCDNLGGTLT